MGGYVVSEVKVLELPKNLSTEGDCFQKCLQIVGRMNALELDNYELLGCVYALNSEYHPIDMQLISEDDECGRIFVNSMPKTIETINEKLPIDLTNKFFETNNDGIIKIKSLLQEGVPVIAGVNPYCFYFMDDYLKNPGGFFKAYHITIVVGIDEERKEFILSDSWIDFRTIRISFDEFFWAMTYGEGIMEFKPYSYYEFRVNTKKNTKNIKHICIEMAIENIDKMLGQGRGNENTGIPSLKRIPRDLEYILTDKIGEESIEKYLLNLFNSVFHKLSWGRRFFSLALSSQKFSDLPQREEYVCSFEDFYAQWIKIAQLILINKNKVNKGRIETIRRRISELLKEEQCKAQELRKKLTYI